MEFVRFTLNQYKSKESVFNWFHALIVAKEVTKLCIRMAEEDKEHETSKRDELVACKCGQVVPFEVYSTVAVSQESCLKEKVLRREINLFKCEVCGFQQELAREFRYFDRDRRLLVWVVPEGKTIFGIGSGIYCTEIATQLDSTLETWYVHSYDELFGLLSSYDDK